MVMQDITTSYIAVAKQKVTHPWWVTFLLAIVAGACIGFAGAAATAVFQSTDSIVLKATVFPTGLILITMLGAELFTGNCLLVCPMITQDVRAEKVFKNLGLVYIGNLLGAILVAGLTFMCFDFQTPVKPNIDLDHMLRAFTMAVPCNILVCLAVILAAHQKTLLQKCIALFIPIFIFVVCGMEHSIANMYYIFVDIFNGQTTFGEGILYSILPSSLGNILGGIAIATLFSLTQLKKE